jgi:hypothetical protein
VSENTAFVDAAIAAMPICAQCGLRVAFIANGDEVTHCAPNLDPARTDEAREANNDHPPEPVPV